MPVFTFEIVNNAKPVITVDKNAPGIIGQEYKISNITVNTSKATKKYTLYYMTQSDYEKYNFDKSNFETDEEYLDKLQELIDLGVIVEITKDDAEKFDEDNLKFTPAKKGAYFVKCEVLAENANFNCIT